MSRNLRNPEVHREKMFRREVLDWLDRRGQATNHEDKWIPGVADLSWAIAGYEGWLELKSQPTMIDFKKPWPYILRPEQLPWLIRRKFHGCGSVHVLYRFTTNKYALDGMVSPVDVTGFALFDPMVLKAQEDRGVTLMGFRYDHHQPIFASLHSALQHILDQAKGE